VESIAGSSSRSISVMACSWSATWSPRGFPVAASSQVRQSFWSATGGRRRRPSVAVRRRRGAMGPAAPGFVVWGRALSGVGRAQPGAVTRLPRCGRHRQRIEAGSGHRRISKAIVTVTFRARYREAASLFDRTAVSSPRPGSFEWRRTQPRSRLAAATAAAARSGLEGGAHGATLEGSAGHTSRAPADPGLACRNDRRGARLGAATSAAATLYSVDR
jgi:hypothetical protein